MSESVATKRAAPSRPPTWSGADMRLTASDTHGWNAASPTAWQARRATTCHSSPHRGRSAHGTAKPSAPTSITKRGPRRSDIGPSTRRSSTAASTNRLVCAEASRAEPPRSMT